MIQPQQSSPRSSSGTSRSRPLPGCLQAFVGAIRPVHGRDRRDELHHRFGHKEGTQCNGVSSRCELVFRNTLRAHIVRADILRTFTRQDTAITREIQWRLEHELWMDPRAVEVSTTAGVVRLTGEVGTRTDIALIERYAAAVDGVVSVDAHGLRFRFDDRDVTMPPIEARGA